MMNFRYHIVSLIAVFLALAIGVVLGAGPLQTRLARSFETPATVAAEAESAQLRGIQMRSSAEGKGVIALSEKLVAAQLNGANVVTVALPGTDPADITSARESLQRAGATLSGAVTLTDNWDLQGMAQYRETLSTALSSRVQGIPSGASYDDVIGYAVVNVLTTSGAERDIAFEILTDAQTPVLTLQEDPKGAAHAVVVIGPRDSVRAEISDNQDASLHAPSAWTGLARALSSAPKNGVFVGDADSQNSMLAMIRSENIAVTTVDQVGTESANVAMVLALPTAGPQARAFGVGQGATAVFPPLPAAK